MGTRGLNIFVGILSITTTARAVSYVDYKDVPLYSSLAPCAMSAVSYALDSLTDSICPSGITALQSCACTKGNNAVEVAKTISSSVSYQCGTTATEDFVSASQAFALYCNPAATITAPPGLPTPVTKFITDLPYWSSMAPCAKSAVSYAVNYLTYDKCQSGAGQLQSCACTKGNNAAEVQKTIASSISYSCGKTASEDFTSASRLFQYYCTPGSQITAAPINPNGVAEYITDLPAFLQLAPCAQSAVSYAVQYLTYDICPEGPSALNYCACTKNQNSFVASSSINSAVNYSCGSTHTADITSAQAVFAGYCNLGAGITSFPVASTLPGVMTYFITDMPIYSSLAPCAQSGVSEAIGQLTYSLCPPDPAPLASCACVKDQNSIDVSKLLTSSVKYECSDTATEDVASAVEVYNVYCSAAKGLVTPTGITASAETSDYGTIAGPTAGSNPGAPTPTPTSGSANGDNSGGDGKSKKKGAPIGAIVGGIVGGIAVIIIFVAVFFFMRQRKRRQSSGNGPLLVPADGDQDKPPGTAVTMHDGEVNELSGKDWKGGVPGAAEAPAGVPAAWAAGSELDGSQHNTQSTMYSPSTLAHSELHGSQHNGQSAMYSSPTMTHSELHGSPQSPHSPFNTIHEASGVGAPRPELQGYQHGGPQGGHGNTEAHEMQAYPMSATMNNPVYEMPAEYTRGR